MMPQSHPRFIVTLDRMHPYQLFEDVGFLTIFRGTEVIDQYPLGRELVSAEKERLKKEGKYKYAGKQNPTIK